MGDNGLPPKREWGVSGDRARGGSLEGMCGGGKFSAKEERGFA